MKITDEIVLPQADSPTLNFDKSSHGNFHENGINATSKRRADMDISIEAIDIKNNVWKKPKLQMSPLPLENSKKTSFPSPDLDRAKQPPDAKSLYTVALHFISTQWTVPAEQFDFVYFEFSIKQYIKAKRIDMEPKTVDIKSVLGELVAGGFLPGVKVLTQCEVCFSYLFLAEAVLHKKSCILVSDDEIEFIPSPGINHDTISRITIEDNDIEIVDRRSKNDMDEIQIISEKKGTNKRKSTPAPKPVRTSYPHYENPGSSLVPCPVCYMKYRPNDIERHTAECCEKTFSSSAKKGQYNVTFTAEGVEKIVGSSGDMNGESMDHPTTKPSKNRRVIRPK